MLLKYIVSNYKSIGHHIEFSMFPTENNIDSRFLTTISTKMGEWKILKRGALFGPNASGKSSFVESINFAKNYILDGQKSGKVTSVPQFEGDFEDLNNITTFQFMFYLEDEVYEYGFSMDRKKIHEEWLMILSKSDFVPVFTRKTDANDKTEIEITSKFGNSIGRERQLAETLKETIKAPQKNQLFLYKLYDNGITKMKKFIKWFESINVIFPNTKIRGLPLRVKEDELFRNFLSENLYNLDTGVSNLSAPRTELNFKDFAQEMDLPEEIINDIEEKGSGIFDFNGKYYIFFEKNDKTMLVQLMFEHILNGKKVKFNIDSESDGTVRLLDLLPILFKVDSSEQRIYIIDELDRSLHTKLTRYLLERFVIDSENSLNQLIFTAHDVNLLNLKLLRKEEVWFVDKNRHGESAIKPLSDFEISENYDALSAYLVGRFGALPNIKGVL